MKRTLAISIAAVALLAVASGADAQRAGQVCADPARPCARGFRPNELPFVLPRDSVARAEFRSEPFYAVILRSGPRCSIAERERVAAQALFPGRKVFSQRFECDVDQSADDEESGITYTSVAERTAFLAVYAGATREQALRVLASARGRFPGANLRRMQAVLVYP
ncbi:hypothetical protein [Longimicrobium sp.]|uniref:hypothetical protein n=1 Tax=Longimicrobium sp. TaxID=2029185 RepID=UPI002C812AEA|nr:hypothetical protein [Longimicrobium sp.]HSU13897.1 hypothetical protein [Longimicrobium sp.]